MWLQVKSKVCDLFISVSIKVFTDTKLGILLRLSAVLELFLLPRNPDVEPADCYTLSGVNKADSKRKYNKHLFKLF